MIKKYLVPKNTLSLSLLGNSRLGNSKFGILKLAVAAVKTRLQVYNSLWGVYNRQEK